MDTYADMGCVLKVNTSCDACKMKVVEVLSSICGVYNVTIDAEKGTAKVTGEVDPNILLRALARSGKHAKVVWVNLKSPAPRRPYYDNGSHGCYNSGMDYPYLQMRRPLPQHSWYDTPQYNYHPRRPLMGYQNHPW